MEVESFMTEAISDDVELPTVSNTPRSNWERLDPNDNPSNRFNCFITTAAGLLGLNSVKDFKTKTSYSPYMKGI